VTSPPLLWSTPSPSMLDEWRHHLMKCPDGTFRKMSRMVLLLLGVVLGASARAGEALPWSPWRAGPRPSRRVLFVQHRC